MGNYFNLCIYWEIARKLSREDSFAGYYFQRGKYSGMDKAM